ncbi:MAG: SpoIIE family protein phosphatase [Lachnospiraceae bacterium]|nr:SpoIIE family protein phosphatase [Lachnospiraceae bacterium]
MKSVKSIKTKLLLVILGVAFGFSFFFLAGTILQLEEQNSIIQEKSSEEAEILSHNAKESLSELNKRTALDFSSACNKYFNQSFANIRKHAVSIGREMSRLYQSDNRVPLDNNVGIIRGTKRSEIKEEFGKVAPIRDFIRNLPSYNPKQLGKLDLYVVTESGMCLDGTSSRMRNSDINLRREDWYQQAKKQKDIYWSGISVGQVTGKEIVVCVQPIYDGSGRFMGCAAGDIVVGKFQEMLEEFDERQIKSVIFFDRKGKLMYATNGYQNVTEVEGYLGQQEIVEAEDEIYAFNTLEETGWTICLVLDQEAMNQTTEDIETGIEKNADEITDIVGRSIRISIMVFVGLVAVGAFFVLILTNLLAAGLVKPIRQLMGQVEAAGAGDLDQVITVDTRDEIGQLAEVFNQMLGKLKDYMRNLQLVTGDRERMAAEADVAKKIQKNMLPDIFPAFPERNEFDVYAVLKPVEEGDSNFYDFFLVDKAHFCIVLGDVAGSGVPATMFAVVTRTHIKNYAKLGYQPDRILVETNNQLSEKNDAGMTASVFICIVDLLSGSMQYVNAGGQNPFWKHSGKDFDVLPCKSCFSLANMGNMPYTQQTVQLAQGDMLFLYTKGIPETVDDKGNEYTEGCLQEQLNGLVGHEYQLDGLLGGINRELEQFSGDTPQKQDGTMLVFRYFGKG